MNKPLPTSVPGVPPGFSAQLRGASLFDLIQFEATSRGRRVVRVSSEGRSGLIYFDGGRIVHASAARLTGEPAVREMLGWRKGTFARFDHFDGAWPKFETIGASTESVLLRAAQALDEGAGNVVALPRREEASGVIPRPPPLPVPDEVMMRLSPDGELMERQGPDDGWSDLVAYTAQLTDLVGDLLGLAGFETVELTFQNGKCVLARTEDRTILAVKAGARATLEGLRSRMGLGA